MQELIKAAAKSLNAGFLTINADVFSDYLGKKSFQKAESSERGRKKKLAYTNNKPTTILQLFKQLRAASPTSRLVLFLENMAQLPEHYLQYLSSSASQSSFFPPKRGNSSPFHSPSNQQFFNNLQNLQDDIFDFDILSSENLIITGCEAMSKKAFNSNQDFLEKLKKKNVLPVFIAGMQKVFTTINVLPPQDEAKFKEWQENVLLTKKMSCYLDNLAKISETISKSGNNIYSWQYDETFLLEKKLIDVMPNHVMTNEHVQKIANLVIGKKVITKEKQITNQDVLEALTIWHEGLEQKKQILIGSEKKEKNEKKKLNTFEKRFIQCIVTPNQIQTTFQDIGALEKQKELLKTIISLPIERPDIFQFGVLKKSATSVLLFGPPGTGKTLLAKAVAGECKANFISVSAGDILNKYIGESEKNIQGLFSLSRKLSPCVLFFDELDALFMSRDFNRQTAREVINQLMLEWDGLKSNNNGNVIIMGATNRPFDLDDAVLRRFPRRLLVDLPDTEAREQILKIQLANEELNHDVTLKNLAELTKDYSGSDLKNLCVAAAFNAVKDQLLLEKQLNNENENNNNNKPLKRVLTLQHFLKALSEIKASTSSESDSALQLRKWDQAFGEGKKRKKEDVRFHLRRKMGEMK